MNPSTFLFSPKIGGDTEGVENLTTYTSPTFCHPVNHKREKEIFPEIEKANCEEEAAS